MKNKLVLLLLLTAGITEQTQGAWRAQVASFGHRAVIGACVVGGIYGAQQIHTNFTDDFDQLYTKAKRQESKEVSVLYASSKQSDKNVQMKSELRNRQLIKKLFEKHTERDICLFFNNNKSLFIKFSVISFNGRTILLIDGTCAKTLFKEANDFEKINGVVLTFRLPKKDELKLSIDLNQIKGVAFHEMGHVVHKDSNAKIATLTIGNLLLGLGATIGAQSFYLPIMRGIKSPCFALAGSLFGALTGATTMHAGFAITRAAYSRFEEQRADEFALRIAPKDSIKGLRQYLINFNDFTNYVNPTRKSTFHERILQYLLSTHPSPLDRIAACDRALEKMEKEEQAKRAAGQPPVD